jgi:hypothetical protein
MPNSPQLSDILAKATAMYGQTQSEARSHPLDDENWPSLMHRAILDFSKITPFVTCFFSANGSLGRRSIIKP